MDTARPSRSRTRLACLTVAVLLGLAGCGDDGDDPQEAAPEAGSTETVDDGADPAAADEAEAVDACALLEESEVEPHIGAAPGTGGDGTCTWENAESLESVTVTVGSPNTAIGDLPEPSPYGDAEPVDGIGADARYAASAGVVEFVGEGDRLCELQVATVSLEEGARREAAVELAGLAAGRIGD